MTTTTTTPAEAAEFIATEIAWNGSASPKWVAAKLAEAGHDVCVADVIACAVANGLLRYVERIDTYVVTKRINARVFGRKFAEWVAE